MRVRVCVCARDCLSLCTRVFETLSCGECEENRRIFLSAGKDVSFKMMIWQQQQHCLSQKPSQTLFPPSFRLDAFSSKLKDSFFISFEAEVSFSSASVHCVEETENVERTEMESIRSGSAEATTWDLD